MKRFTLFIDVGEDIIRHEVYARSAKGARFKAYADGYTKETSEIIKVVERELVELPQVETLIEILTEDINGLNLSEAQVSFIRDALVNGLEFNES